MALFIVITLLLLLPSTLLLLWPKKMMKKLPPGPPQLPFIGNLHQLGKMPHISLLNLSKIYGPLMLLRLGSVPTVVVSSSEMAKEVLKTHDIDLCSRPPSPGRKRLSYNFLDVAFAPYSESWKYTRKLFISDFHSERRSQSLWAARKVEMDRLIGSLELKAMSQAVVGSVTSLRVVDMGVRITNLVHTIVTTAALGKAYGPIDAVESESKKIPELLDNVLKSLFGVSWEEFFPRIGWVIDAVTEHRQGIERSFRSLDEFFESVIEAHMDPKRPKPEHEDLVDFLIGLSKDQSSLTNNHIKAVLMNTFVAGTDTTAITAVWALAELVRNPRVMKKLQAEIRGQFRNKLRIEPDDLTELNYLKLVVKETLRLHAPGTLLVPRVAIRHCTIGGYDINRGTRVLVNTYALARDPKTWTNANEFYPERFEGSELDYKGQHFELIPFGSGRRMCPAIGIGIDTVQYTLANLLHCFDWEVPNELTRDQMKMEEEQSQILHKKNCKCFPAYWSVHLSLSNNARFHLKNNCQ